MIDKEDLQSQEPEDTKSLYGVSQDTIRSL